MREFRGILLIVLLVLLVLIGLFIKDTYARYSSVGQGTGSIEVARWAFETDNAISTIDVNLSDTYDPTTLVDGKIAPGTSGSFTIKLKNTTSETGVDFSVSIGTIENLPSNLIFYKDSGYTTQMVVGTGAITGQLEPVDDTELSITIYWKWDYSTSNAGDVLDTSDGIAARNLTIPVNISGVQADPNGPAVTTHIDSY